MNEYRLGSEYKLLLLFVCVLCLLVTGCNHKPQAKQQAPVVNAIKLTTSTIPIYKEYIGITQSIAAVGIRARVQGFLEKMNFVEGKAVKKNQLLYVIDQKPFQAQLDLEEGTLVKSIADRDYQKVEYERMKILVKKGDISQSNYDKVYAQFKAAEADVQIAQAQVENARINLGYCSMYAIFDGIISKKYVDVGNLVGGTENTLLANVVQLNPLYIEFSPSVSDFGDMLTYRANMPFKVIATLSHNQKLVFKGKTDLINNEADTPTSTILMRAIVQNPEQLLLPGIYINIQVELTNKAKALLIPSQAVLDIQGQQSVYIVNTKNQVESRNIVTAGQYQQQYIVSSGVAVNDVIITDGLQKIGPGEQVTVNLAATHHD